VFSPNVGEFVRQSAYNLAQSTLATAAKDAAEAVADLRGGLLAGLSSGETAQEINRRVYQIFRDPARAARIGQTESMRAMNGAAYLTAIDTGVITKTRWLASPDACDICLSLNGKERSLGEPFLILPRAKPPYNVVLHPPLHPTCFCVTTEIIDANATIDPQTADDLRRLTVDPSRRSA